LTKICNKCKEKYPATTEYFYKNSSNHIDGLFPYCKSCAISKSKKRNVSFKDDIKNKNLIKKHNKRGVKPPFNYAGNKYFMFEELKTFFPDSIETFVDLMCGSGMVGINSECNKLILNDIDKNMINCLKEIKNNTLLKNIENIKINNIDDYNDIRDSFNQVNNVYKFYMLVHYGFNQNPIYDKNNNFVTCYSNGKTYFNQELKNRISPFSKLMNLKPIEFYNKSFEFVYDLNLNKNDFVFIDPPYNGTFTTYNTIWDNNKDFLLFKLLDYLNKKNIKFGITNTTRNNNIEVLVNKYNIKTINKSKHKIKNIHNNDSEEIFIYNY
jgi:DNA adenine methylase Dam